MPRAASYYDTPRARDLAMQIVSLENRCWPSPTDRKLADELREIQAREAWQFANPGNSGRFQIACRGKLPTFNGGSAGALTFDTREGADAYLASHSKPEHGDMFSVVEVLTRAGIEEALAAAAPVTPAGEVEAARAKLRRAA